MATMNELKTLIADFKAKKNILDNHTNEIVDGIKEWCIKEYDRIKNERENINKFATENWDVIRTKSPNDGYGDHHYEGRTYRINKGFGLYLGFYCDDKSVCVSLDSPYEYEHNVGFTWTNLPKPSRSNIFRVENGKYTTFDFGNTSLDYWMDVKRWLAIYNEQLTHITNKLKDLLATLVLEQDTRAKEMMKDTEDILKDEIVEVTISIRKGVQEIFSEYS